MKIPQAVSRASKGAMRWIALAALVALLAQAVYLIRAHWTFLRPNNGPEAWAAIDTLADSLAALGALAVAVFAFRGLRSLRIARDEIVHRATTDAKLSAIQRMEEIAKEIVPLNTKVLDGLAKDAVGVFLSPGDAVVFDPDPTDLMAAMAWRVKLSTETHNRLISFLNRLEAWSVYFTTAVADRDVAFDPIAPLLRSWVGQYYAVLLLLRSGLGPSSGQFPNLIKLYTEWSARMDTQQLARLHKDIAGQIGQAEARLVQAKLPDVIPPNL